MRTNPEHQRGATWKLSQRQSVIDSVFRLYPIPPIFLQVITTRCLKVQIDPLPTGQALWGGHRFSNLTGDLKQTFQRTQLTFVLIQTDGAGEVRDLFIRLQAGTALTRQEVRDAWPG